MRVASGVRTAAQIFLIILLVGIAVIVISPLVLYTISTLVEADWGRLSAIGQSYSGAATVISSVALVFVVQTVRLQVRQASVAQEQLMRQNQFELNRLLLEQPELLTIAPGGTSPQEAVVQRQTIYFTMLLRHFQLVALIERMSQPQIERMIDAEFFRSSRAAFQHWSRVREFWLASEGDSHRRLFRLSVDAVYQRLAVTPDEEEGDRSGS